MRKRRYGRVQVSFARNALTRNHKLRNLVAQSCPTLCDPTDCSPSGHGILQARILGWVAMPWHVSEMYHFTALGGGRSKIKVLAGPSPLKALGKALPDLSPASGACLGLWQHDSNFHMPFSLYMSGTKFPHCIKIPVILE